MDGSSSDDTMTMSATGLGATIMTEWSTDQQPHPFLFHLLFGGGSSSSSNIASNSSSATVTATVVRLGPAFDHKHFEHGPAVTFVDTAHGANGTNGTGGSGGTLFDAEGAAAAAAAADLSTLAGYLLAGVLVVLIVVTVIGNTLIILAVCTTRRLRTVTNCFVMSLAMADWMVGTFVMPPAVAVHLVGSWQLGWWLCDIWISLDVLLCTASILSLCAISIDRWVSPGPFGVFFFVLLPNIHFYLSSKHQQHSEVKQKHFQIVPHIYLLHIT